MPLEFIQPANLESLRQQVQNGQPRRYFLDKRDGDQNDEIKYREDINGNLIKILTCYLKTRDEMIFSNYLGMQWFTTESSFESDHSCILKKLQKFLTNFRDIAIWVRFAKDENEEIGPSSSGYTIPMGDQDQKPGIVLSPPWHKGRSKEEKIHTLFHEASHYLLETQDVPPTPYGRDNCLNLARSKSKNALENADNWGFFLDEIFHTGTSNRFKS